MTVTSEAKLPPKNQMRPGQIIGTAFVVLVAVGLLGLLAWGMLVPKTNVGSVTVRNRDARNFTLPQHNGAPVELAKLQGKPVVLNFWASWCEPCKLEAPILESVYRKYSGTDVIFLGVNVWDKNDDAREYLRQYNITFDSAIDATGGTAIDYGVSGIPETFFIDRNGKIMRHFIGPLGDKQLTGFIDELLQ